MDNKKRVCRNAGMVKKYGIAYINCPMWENKLDFIDLIKNEKQVYFKKSGHYEYIHTADIF